MKDYLKRHEDYILNILKNEDKNLAKVLHYHQQQIRWIQHERLIHLLVMLFTTFLFIISFSALFVIKGWLMIVLSLILFILTIFYIFHYYLLENTVQRWYKISNLLDKKSNSIGTNFNIGDKST